MARKGFWGKFDDLMDSLPEVINDASINTIGDNNTVYTSNSTVKQVSFGGSSKSTIKQGGNTIVISTKKGKTTVTVNGKEYVEKQPPQGDQK